MPQTSKSFRYPSASDTADVPRDIQNLASDVDSYLDGFSSLPSQTGNSGKYLTTDGTDASWAEVSGGGSSSSKWEVIGYLAQPFNMAYSGNYIHFGSIPSNYNSLKLVWSNLTASTGYGALYPSISINQSISIAENRFFNMNTQGEHKSNSVPIRFSTSSGSLTIDNIQGKADSATADGFLPASFMVVRSDNVSQGLTIFNGNLANDAFNGNGFDQVTPITDLYININSDGESFTGASGTSGNVSIYGRVHLYGRA